MVLSPERHAPRAPNCAMDSDTSLAPLRAPLSARHCERSTGVVTPDKFVAEHSGGPPREWFDEDFATALVGRTLLVGITQKDHAGKVIRRYQVFGVVSE